MAFRASGVIAEQAFATVRRQGVATKEYATQRKAQLQQASVDANLVLSIAEHCRAVLTIFDNAAQTPGLPEYARAQVNDPNYDIVAEYQAMRSAIVALRDAVVSLFPKDASGWLLYQQLAADGTITVRTFTSAQTAVLIPHLDGVINSIA